MGQPVIKSIPCPIQIVASDSPDRFALTDGRRKVTYKELDCMIDQAIHHLRLKGVEAGNVVAVLDNNSISYAILFYAALRSGFILMPLNARLTSAEWRRQLNAAGCRLLVVAGQFTDAAKSLDIELADIDEITSDYGRPVSIDSPHELSLDREALIIYSSGSSGASRGIVLTWHNLYYSALGIESMLACSSDDCWLAALPFFHIGGISILFRAVRAGCGVHIFDKFRQETILEVIGSKRGCCLSVVPTMLRDLISADLEHRLNKVRTIILGGAPLDDSLRRKCQQLDLPVLTTYGMTETSSMVTLLPPDHPPDKISTSGKILPHRQIRIAAPGEEGPILVRGEVLFSRYLNQIEPLVDDQGWFETGDIGKIDEDGYLTVTGRSGRFIISGGENVDLNQIEQALASLEGIEGAVVLPRSDNKWGERPVAIVQLSDCRLTEAKIKNRLSKMLASISIPERVIIIDRLPLTGSGKYDRQSLIIRFKDVLEDRG